MKQLVLLALVLCLGFTFGIGEAEAAKRFGGGKTTGMKRQTTAPDKAPAATNAMPASNAAAAAQPKRSWMGPVAGLAAGLGLAALASHFGFGEEMASMLMIGLLVMAVMAVIGFVMRRRASPQPAMAGAGMQYARAGTEPVALPQRGFSVSQPAAAAPVAAGLPAGFDREDFLRGARVLFIRLQAANDAANLADIREFTTPEMFAEVRMEIAERGEAAHQTDVVSVKAELIEIVAEAERQVASVHFNAMLREGSDAQIEPVEEIWHLVLPQGRKAWCLAGIQQVQ